MYLLLSRVDGLLALKATFAVYIRSRGAEIVRLSFFVFVFFLFPFFGFTLFNCDHQVGGGEERDKTMVQELIQFKRKTELIVEKSFHNNTQFVYCEKESFENFVNIRQNKPAELIGEELFFVQVNLVI